MPATAAAKARESASAVAAPADPVEATAMLRLLLQQQHQAGSGLGVGSGSAQQSMQCHELVRLLLRFGAEPSTQNAQTGDSALHVLAEVTNADHSIVFTFYRAGGNSLNTVTNAKGMTPHTLAVSCENKRMARFLFDAVMFESLPFCLPGLASAFLVGGFYLLVHFCGPVYGSLYAYLLYMLTTFSLCQWQVVDLRGRAFVGAFLGFVLTAVAVYYIYVAPHMSLLVTAPAVVLLGLLLLSINKFYRIKPLCAPRRADRSDLAARIIRSAPSDGTDDETRELCRQMEAEELRAAEVRAARAGISKVDVESFVPDEARVLGASADLAGAGGRKKRGGGDGISSSSSSSHKFVKDSFTGQLRRSAAEDGEIIGDPGAEERRALLAGTASSGGVSGALPGVRCRSLGPRLCGECVTDKRCFARHSLHPAAMRIVDALGLSTATLRAQLEAQGPTGHLGREVIAMASHCPQCNMCVVHQDHHSNFLGNCVGRGNKRWYWLFLVTCMMGCGLFVAAAKYVQQFRVCAETPEIFNRIGVFGLVSREWCAFTTLPAFYGLTAGVFAMAVYCFFLMQVQIVCVTRETTFLNVIKNRFETIPPTWTKQGVNLLSFLLTGRYNVHYPNVPGTTPTSSANSAGSNSGGAGAGRGVDSEREKGLQMLSDLESRMQQPGGSGGGGKKSSSPVDGTRSRSSTATYTAPTAELSDAMADGGVGQASSSSSSAAAAAAATVEDGDDYDFEFAASAINTYQEHYFGCDATRGYAADINEAFLQRDQLVAARKGHGPAPMATDGAEMGLGGGGAGEVDLLGTQTEMASIDRA